MLQIQFQKYQFKIQEKNSEPYIFDEVRKKYVKLTNEEWVRQHFLHYFMYDLSYSKTKIAVEKQIKINNLNKRFDILVYSNNHQPFILVECKAQNEPLNEQVLQQSLNYNMTLKVPYVVISNGKLHRGWHIDNGTVIELNKLPCLEN